MKQKFLYILGVLLLAGSAAAHAQTNKIVLGQPVVERQDGQIFMQVPVDFSSLDLYRQAMVVLTPVLYSADGQESENFAPLVITGRTRAKALHRETGLRNYVFDIEPQAVINTRDRDPKQFLMTMRGPFQEWMRDGKLVIDQQTTACANRLVERNEITLVSPLLAPVFEPQFGIAYIVPPTEQVKERSESYAAHLNFVVNRYDLLRDFKNNAEVLDEVDRIFTEIRNDPNLKITKLAVTGFASPEGNFDSNMTLSKNRAFAFVNYLKEHHGIAQEMIDVSWKGEDWEGLRALVDKSSLIGRQVILDIIDNTPNINERKRQMAALPSYRSVLLPQFYAPLRRNEYTITYVARPFDVDEAREIIRTKPQQLSLNEMFLVANTYPKGSREFKEVFDIATRLFPNDPIAIANSAALDIEQGALEAGINRLSALRNMPEAVNNMGVAFIRQNEYAKAEEAFKQAAAAGNAVARENLRQFQLWQQSK